MNRILFLSVLLTFGLVVTANATPITYSASGVAAYEELVEVSPGVYHVNYNEIELHGSVTFDDQIEVHTADKTYYSYTMVDFQVSTSRDSWGGTTGLLHWESDDSYLSPQDQYPGFRELYMAGFLGWFSRFDFNEADGADYPYDNMARWLQLPPQVEIWSDNLYNTDASYVSFTLTAPETTYPIPEPTTLFLLSGGILGYAGMRSRRKKKPGYLIVHKAPLPGGYHRRNSE